MSARKCVVPVHVQTEAGPVVYSAGDEIPAEHVALISNPNVWGADEGEDDAPDSKPKSARAK